MKYALCALNRRCFHNIAFRSFQASEVFTIGTGTIGSAAEESSRKKVGWEEGSAYFLPCSKGVTCGWIHALADDAETKHAADVVAYSLKISPETLQSMDEKQPEDMSCWVAKSKELFRRCLAKSQLQSGDDENENLDNKRDEAIESVALSDEESMTMNLIVELVQ